MSETVTIIFLLLSNNFYCQSICYLNGIDDLFLVYTLIFTLIERLYKIFITWTCWQEMESIYLYLRILYSLQSIDSVIYILYVNIYNIIKILPISQSYKWVLFTRDKKYISTTTTIICVRTSLNVMFDADN
jgi:hypothetical protein